MEKLNIQSNGRVGAPSTVLGNQRKTFWIQDLSKYLKRNQKGIILVNISSIYINVKTVLIYYYALCSNGLKRGPKPKERQKQIQESGSSGSDVSSDDEDEENREKPFLRKSKRKKRKKKKDKDETPAFLIQTASGRTPKATLRYELCR